MLERPLRFWSVVALFIPMLALLGTARAPAAGATKDIFDYDAQKAATGVKKIVFVADTARALVEHNLFAAVPPRLRLPLAVWTVASPGAMKMPGSVEGFVRLGANSIIGGAVAAAYLPQDVPDPPYNYRTYPFETLPFEKAIACLADRSGRTGAAVWNESLCTP